MISDKPFERTEGQTQQDAIFNRINAIKRIQHLCGVDLANETLEFKKLVDIEMYTRWYKDYPSDHKIDEEFCQRCAIITKELKEQEQGKLKVSEEGADERVKELYAESKLHPFIPQELNKIAEPEKISLFKNILKIFKRTA